MTAVLVPRESINDDTVIVRRLLLASGSIATEKQVVVEIETSKTMLDIESPEAGPIHHNLVEGQEIPVGGLLFSVGEIEPAQAPATAPSSPHATADTVKASTPPPPALLSRAAETIAGTLGVALSAFAGRWVTSADLLNHGQPAKRPVKAQPSEPGQMTQTIARPAIAHEDKTLGKRKRAEIESLERGRHAATTSTIGIRVRLPGSRVVRPESLFADSIADLVIYEGARLLRAYPELNAFNIDGRTNATYAQINFGVSFDNQQNLKVLALKSADTLPLPDLQRQFLDLLELYESGRPIPTDTLSSATVTLSDLSHTGATFMLPLINGQQSLILGITREDPRTYSIFASFDHRLTEGLRVTHFLEALRERIASHFRDAAGISSISCDSCGRSMQDELMLGSRGFVNITLGDGTNGRICRNCFEGR